MFWNPHCRGLVVMLLILCAGTLVGAQENSDEPRPVSEQDLAEIETRRQALRTAFEEDWSIWKPLSDKLQMLNEEFQTADVARRREIAAEFSETLPKYNQQLPELRKSAIELYQADPNTDERVIELLKSFAKSDLEQDQVQSAASVIELLIQHEATSKGIYELAALAAFCQNDFAAARLFKEKAINQNSLSNAIAEQLGDLELKQRQWEAEADLRASDKLPQVKLTTTQGVILIDLFEDRAPNTVANFINLVESGFYDGLTFHRVLGNFMAQTGCPIGNGTGGPGYSIACECDLENACHHFAGTLSMAHAGRNTGGSQFFMTFRPTPHLDQRHTVFGRVSSGMDVLLSLQRISPRQPERVEPDRILKAEVIRKTMGKDYTPVKFEGGDR